MNSMSWVSITRKREGKKRPRNKCTRRRERERRTKEWDRNNGTARNRRQVPSLSNVANVIVYQRHENQAAATQQDAGGETRKKRSRDGGRWKKQWKPSDSCRYPLAADLVAGVHPLYIRNTRTWETVKRGSIWPDHCVPRTKKLEQSFEQT